jgi:hypothetical protein
MNPQSQTTAAGTGQNINIIYPWHTEVFHHPVIVIGYNVTKPNTDHFNEHMN